MRNYLARPWLTLLNAGLLLVGALLLGRNWPSHGDSADFCLAVALIVTPASALFLLLDPPQNSNRPSAEGEPNIYANGP